MMGSNAGARANRCALAYSTESDLDINSPATQIIFVMVRGILTYQALLARQFNKTLPLLDLGRPTETHIA
jgi:hypothetical protein